MHVLHLSATGAIGGAERSLLDILASVQQTTPDWRLSVVTGADGNLVAEARALGAGVTVIPYGAALARLGESGRSGARLGAAALAGRLARSARPAVQYIVELRRVIEELGPDVIHTHGLKMHILAAWASRSPAQRARPRVVWHVHDYVGTRRATARFLRWSLRRCDAIVTNSSSVAADVHETLHPSVPVVAVHNAVDLRRFSPSGPRLDLDRLAGLPAAPRSVVRVGLIGTFGRWKGHTTFLDAIARLGESAPIRAYVIGGALYHTAGSQYSSRNCVRCARASGLAGRVGFTGFVEQRRRGDARARHRRAREHGARTIRSRHRRSDGVRPRGHRQRRRRRARNLHAGNRCAGASAGRQRGARRVHRAARRG